MKMLLVIYDAGIDEDLHGVLKRTGISAWTKLTGATGAGAQGNRFGTQIWPGTNNLLWIALADERVRDLVGALEDLKASYLKPPALQIFTFPAEELGSSSPGA